MTILLAAGPTRFRGVLAADDLLTGSDGAKYHGTKVMAFAHSRLIAASSGDVCFGHSLMWHLARCTSYVDALTLVPAVWPAASTDAVARMKSSGAVAHERELYAELVVIGFVPTRDAFEGVVFRGRGDDEVSPTSITGLYVNCRGVDWGDSPEADPQCGEGMAHVARWALSSMAPDSRSVMGNSLHVVEMTRRGASLTMHDLNDA